MSAENLQGEYITYSDGEYQIPDQPMVGAMPGDGIGPDIWSATKMVLDAAVEKAYDGKRKICWQPLSAGEVAFKETGTYLPDATLETIEKLKIAIKGPLTTPIGGGMRSLNVALRHHFDLFACIRPVRYYEGVPNPMKRPGDLDVVIFRENTEDVYAGLEWAAGSDEAEALGDYLRDKLQAKVRPGSALGIKPMSPEGSKRLIRAAIQYAIDNDRKMVTMVHKGNIMKFTEGAFCQWGYDMAKAEFADKIVTEEEIVTKYQGEWPPGKIILNDRIADAMFQQLLLRPDEYDVLATPNLNGDYLSDACAAQVGGLGIAPGANVGDGIAIFEATHGTAPKYAGLDKVNPGSLILSGKMMLDFMGWDEAGDLVEKALQATILGRQVTYDLARQMEGGEEVRCSTFGELIVSAM
ncbi:MAG: NADP-dependent isocitrate dehydrogenase [Deltaproteobacteria bacterium]|nr:MAG: NADP-dependent isocitrate dehydrogenase [Deltaproteobacteria bacterium]